MSAKTDLPLRARDLGHAPIPSDVGPSMEGIDMGIPGKAPEAPPTRRERRAHALFGFGLQGVYLLGLALVMVVPMMFVPSFFPVSWMLFKTIIVMDVVANVCIAAGLLLVVERRPQSTADGA